MADQSEKKNGKGQPEFSLNDRIEFNGHDSGFKEWEDRVDYFYHYRNECQNRADQ